MVEINRGRRSDQSRGWEKFKSFSHTALRFGMLSSYRRYPTWTVEPKLQMAAPNVISSLMSNVDCLTHIDKEMYQIGSCKNILLHSRNYNC